jgi:hypothetical protein
MQVAVAEVVESMTMDHKHLFVCHDPVKHLRQHMTIRIWTISYCAVCVLRRSGISFSFSPM